MVLVRIMDVDIVQNWVRALVRACLAVATGGALTPVECVLIVAARVVCDLYARPPLIGVLEEVDIRALIEPVVPRSFCLGAIEVVDVSKAVVVSFHRTRLDYEGHDVTYSVATFSSPGRTAILQSSTGREKLRKLRSCRAQFRG